MSTKCIYIDGNGKPCEALPLNEEIAADEYAGQKRLLIDRRLKLKEKVEDSEETSMTWLELAENFFETAYRARTIYDLASNNPMTYFFNRPCGRMCRGGGNRTPNKAFGELYYTI